MLSRLSREEQPCWNDLAAQIANFSLKHRNLLQLLNDGVAPPPEAFGELLLSLVNLARLKGYQAETCLHKALSRLE